MTFLFSWMRCWRYRWLKPQDFVYVDCSQSTSEWLIVCGYGYSWVRQLKGTKNGWKQCVKWQHIELRGRGDLFNEVWGLFLTYHTHTDTQVKKSECFLNALYILILNIELSMERTTLKVLWSSSSDSSDTGTFSPLAVIWNGTSEAFFVRSRTSVFTSFWWKWFEN